MNTLLVTQRILAKELDLDFARLDPALPLGELGIDSLTLTESLFKLEDEFSVSFEGLEETPRTLQEIADLIDRLITEKARGKVDG